MNGHVSDSEEESPAKRMKTTDDFISKEFSNESLPEVKTMKESNISTNSPSSDCRPNERNVKKMKNSFCQSVSVRAPEMDMPSTSGICNGSGSLPEDESSDKRIVCRDVATLTEVLQDEQENDTDGELLDCKYCKARISKLRLVERIKAKSSSLRFPRYIRRPLMPRMRKMCKNKGCQTSAALFEEAEMTEAEKSNLAAILRLTCGKSSKTESFCKCVLHGKEHECRCGEDDEYFEWVWDEGARAHATDLSDNDCQVVFHKDFSCGTAAVRGTQAMRNDQYFWEIKLTSRVYGTDMMVGVGTEAVDLNACSSTFCSMIGYDGDSWGISYDGRIQHESLKEEFCSQFEQGSIVGVHLDMWHGTLTFFKNRQVLGTAYRGLRGRTLYPMACSTAARSGMKIIATRSFPSSLQLMCCQKLRQSVPAHLDVVEELAMPPGLKTYLGNKMPWLVRPLTSQEREWASKEVCSICQPLEGILEGLTDYEESDEEQHSNLHHILPAEVDSSDCEEEMGVSFRSPIVDCAILGGALDDCGEGSSMPSPEELANPKHRHPYGVKRFKRSNGKYSMNLIFGEKEQYPNEESQEESDDSDTEIMKQFRLSKKRKWPL